MIQCVLMGMAQLGSKMAGCDSRRGVGGDDDNKDNGEGDERRGNRGRLTAMSVEVVIEEADGDGAVVAEGKIPTGGPVSQVVLWE